MNGFTVSTRLGLDDWKALVRAVQKRAHHRARGLKNWWLPGVVFIGVIGITGALLERWPDTFNIQSMLVGMLVLLATVQFVTARHRRGLLPTADSVALSPTEFRFESDGFEVRREHSIVRNRWPVLIEITHTPRHIFLWLDYKTAYTIRAADLPASMSVEETVARLRSLHEAGKQAR